jgi:hypothetical protein
LQADNRLADLEAAFDKVEGGDEETTQPEANPLGAANDNVETDDANEHANKHVASKSDETEGATETSAESKARDEKGRFAKGAKQLKAVPDAEAAPATPEGQPPAPTEQPTPGAEALKAPASWKLTVREAHWNKLPPEVQQEVHRREKEAATAVQEVTEFRRFGEAFRNTVAPYEAMIRSEGGTALTAIGSLLQTAAALRTAPPQHKAGLVAGIVKQFGIDIGMLDQALSGQPAANDNREVSHAAYRDPRVDQLMARLQQAEQERQQTVHQSANQTVESFGQGKEFFDDLRQDMADILEVASKRGIPMNLEQAYERAKAFNPEVSAVMRQREAAKAAQNQNNSMQRSKLAASSVRNQPAGVAPPKSAGDNRMSDIEEAIASLSGR